jgi:anti-sigma factor RsiW
MTDRSMETQDLHALVDGALPAHRAAEIEAQLAANPEAAAQVAAYRAQGRALHARFDPVLDEPLPLALLETNGRPARRGSRVAAAIGWLALGAVLGWTGHALKPGSERAATSLPREAAVAHAVYAPEVRHPVEVPAAEHDHLVAWLSKRLGTKLTVPQLEAEGFKLVGGRLLSSVSGNGPVAQFMYQDGGGQRLTLYVRNVSEGRQDTAFRFARENGVSVFYWVDGRYGYALSSELERAQLLKIADSVYRQLNP